MLSSRFRNLCWASLGIVLLVILWGAYVRASGSGAGCGSHWPMCNGEVIPRTPSTKTLIEFTHRITSGLSGIVVLVQVVWAFRLHPRGHAVRKAAAWSGVFMLTEVLVGAGIVLLQYVADDASVGRALWMAIHLVNTFLLVGALTLTAHFASGAPRLEMGSNKLLALLALAALLGTLVVGTSGAVAALGDTLFPAKNLGTALADDLSPTAHFLVRLRVIHPFAAVGVALLLLATRFMLAARRPSVAVQRTGMLLRLAISAQVIVGFVNLLTLAPTALQLLHLLLADALWMALVLFVASAFAEQPAVDEESVPESAEPAPAGR